jgi:hypothetical protein
LAVSDDKVSEVHAATIFRVEVGGNVTPETISISLAKSSSNIRIVIFYVGAFVSPLFFWRIPHVVKKTSRAML